jgi:hypothetical protein
MLVAGLAGACSAPALEAPVGAPRVTVQIEPSVGQGELPASFRARLRAGAAGAGAPWLIRGEVSDYYERAVRRGELPEALRGRAVPLRFWVEAGDAWLQPLSWLEPDDTYSLVWLGGGALGTWTVASELPRATQLFPALGRPVSRVLVQCAPELEAEPARLSPGDVEASAAPSTHDGQPCVIWRVERELTEPAVLPPRVGDVLLAPALFDADKSAVASCEHGEELYGACIEVWDDRVLVMPLAHDAWWRLEAPQARSVVLSVGQRAVLAEGLAANRAVSLRGTRLAADGVEEDIALDVTTGAPRRHLVLNEVLANPLGAEPDCEWIELVNDSARPASLAGLWLEDGAGRSWLPPTTLGAHEIALLVPAGFRASALDAPIAPGTRLLELDSLGARGLSNSGEALLLVGPEGIVARFPLLAASHAGRSWARRSLDTADDDAQAFAEHGAPGASPGASNTFD